MSIAFIHLSDIHFGQEKGGTLVIHNDAKERLVEDIEREVKKLPEGIARGIIISGDIAYAGKHDEYADAGKWLDRVANAAGCAITDIQVVPGNHDIDRDRISAATAWMLQEIADKGESELDRFLSSQMDRELLYARFSAYQPFAEAYGSPLDNLGGFTGNRIVQLAPGRSLRFIGMNTALTCGNKDQEGRLLLGARQRVLPLTPGEELVVIAHHPLRWLQDSEDAQKYLSNRARVFITGHEHSPSVKVDSIEDGCDLMLLQAGATVPPTADETFTYTYNILEFDWDAKTDALIVIVHPRVWSEDKKNFRTDEDRLDEMQPRYFLGCPNFRQASRVPSMMPTKAADTMQPTVTVPVVQEAGVIEVRKEPSMPAKFSLLRLRFFRDLSGAQRLRVLVDLNALPDDWRELLTHSIEVQILDSLQRTNRLDDLEVAINKIEAEHIKQEGKEHG
ncbi:metallophosphoesterase [Burkholderiaceae bacterium DAT-1]|nr:metallophosphoesterase [Burkholderiaceae bacterium DAT-1]